MAYYRKLPSGLWQATVRGRDGKRHTQTDKLKSVVKAWATQQEAAIARGEFRDPRLGDTKVAAWHTRVSRARGIEDITKAKNASLWRTHCEPEWGSWQMGAVTRLEAQEWVERLKATRRARHQGRPVEPGDEDVPVIGPATIHDVVHIMSQLYTAAMREHPPIVLVNPFDHLELPKIEPRPVEFLEHEEAEALYAAAESIGSDWRTLIELGTEVGLRPGEIYGLHGHRVDWLRSQIQVIDVMTRRGLRQWPKSKRSHRVVPVPARIMEGMSALMAGRSRDALVFTAPQGGPVTDGHFRNRVWYPAVEAAGIRRFPPRVMRHTAASWLVQDGVPLYDVQALLGHEDYATTQRYAHLRPDAHGKVKQSWARRDDAPVTHRRKRPASHKGETGL
jgi:integrase